MKGLQETTTSDAVFLKVKHHSICQDSKTPREGFQSIEVNNPRTGETITKYYKPYKGVEALITRIEWYDTENTYDQRYIGWKIHLNAAGTRCVLDLPFDSRPATRFMKLAENIDYTRPVEFRAWYDQKTEKTAFAVFQDGQAVRQRYTMDNPGDCPPPVQDFRGKWKYDDQMEFLHKRMMDVVIPAVEEAGNNEADGVAPRDPEESDGQRRIGNVPQGGPDVNEDDIPF